MSSPTATGFPDTVVLPESTAPAAKPGTLDGKTTAASGKELPARLPDPPPEDALEASEAVADRLRALSRSLARELRFEVDLDSGRPVIYVLNGATGELIRRIPREELPRLLTESGRFDLKLLDDRL